MIIAGSSLRINISIGKDIGSTGTAEIGFINDVNAGTWPATVSDSENGTAYYDVTPAELSVSGIWKVWAKYEFSDGRLLNAPASQFTVYLEGTVQR